MARKPSPCGTKSAYNRHLRNGEEPCEACRRANTVGKRRQRADERRPKEPLPGVTVADEDTRLSSLQRQREVLWKAMQWAIQDDPSRCAQLSKELREIWREISDLEGVEEGDADGFEDFFEGGGAGITPISSARKRA